MKVLVLGAGAMGGYYGARFIQSGASVDFLVRAQRAKHLAKHGLVVRSDLAPSRIHISTTVQIGPDDTFDLVLLACKSYDLEQAMEAIAPAVERGALVLPILNGLAVYDRLDTRFGRDRILGGVSYIATMLEKTGEIVHMGTHDKLVIGARTEAQVAVAKKLHGLLANDVGIRVLSDNIEQELWDKWAMLSAGAAVTCLLRGNVGEIMHVGGGPALMTQAINECADVARSSGQGLSETTLTQIRGRLLDPNSTWAASMMRDIQQDAPRLEADDIVGDMLDRAANYGQIAPTLHAAYCHLQVYAIRHSHSTRPNV